MSDRIQRDVIEMPPELFAALQQNGGIKAHQIHPEDPLKKVLEQKELLQQIQPIQPHIPIINKPEQQPEQPLDKEYSIKKITELYNWLFKHYPIDAKQLLHNLSLKQSLNINNSVICYKNNLLELTIIFKSFDNNKNFLPINKLSKEVLDYTPIKPNQNITLDELINNIASNNNEYKAFDKIDIKKKKILTYNNFAKPSSQKD